MSTSGRRGKSFTTQVYFRGYVPSSYEDYVKGRDTQFGKVRIIQGGREVSFNINLA